MNRGFRGDDNTGETTPTRQCENAVPNGETVRTWSNLEDNARDFVTRRKGKGRADLIFPLDHENVEKIAADRPDVDGDLAGRRTWIREIDQHHIAGFAPLIHDHGFHF
jgi:hypothetical protein